MGEFLEELVKRGEEEAAAPPRSAEVEIPLVEVTLRRSLVSV